MKKILLLSAVASLFACNEQATIDYTLFSGKVENTDSEMILVRGNGLTQEIKLNEDGSFADTLRLSAQGSTYSFVIGRESSKFYAKNGDELNLTLNAEQFDESIKYSGKGAEESNLLAQIYLINEGVVEGINVLFAKDEEEFTASLEEIKEKVNKAFQASKVNDAFKQAQLKELEYEASIFKMQYESYHGHFAKKPGFIATEDFKSSIPSYDVNDEKLYRSSDKYKELVSIIQDIEIGNAYDETQDYNKAVMLVMDKMTNKHVKENLLKDYSSGMLGPNESLKEVYDYLVANTSEEATKEEYTTTFEKLKKLAKGMPSPTFSNYENHAGGTTSFDDLKGKYTYIDVWATWCGPCIGEIPSLKAVESEYHGKNIQFVSASIDQSKAHDTWVNMVKEKELGGIQLMADNAWKSKFVQDYEINGIPRFILVDPEGNIVSADAPRPSDPKLKELFATLEI